jgi:hypothetical protein
MLRIHIALFVKLKSDFFDEDIVDVYLDKLIAMSWLIRAEANKKWCAAEAAILLANDNSIADSG